MTELVFIEGVSGVGKSTMVRMISEELKSYGFRIRTHVEFDYTNPIDFYSTAYWTSIKKSAYFSQSKCSNESAN